MKTVGQILKKRRLDRGLTLEEISTKTKIKKLFLKAIETNNYSVFDSLATAQGFIRNYGQLLGLDSKQLLAVFKRDFGVTPSGQIKWRRDFRPIKIRPERKINFFLLGLVVGAVIFFLWYFRWVIFPPPLTIYRPSSLTVTNNNHLVVEGRTLSGAKVWVNNLMTLADEKGDFAQTVLLLPGINEVEIKVSYKKKTRLKKISVIYHPSTQVKKE